MFCSVRVFDNLIDIFYRGNTFKGITPGKITKIIIIIIDLIIINLREFVLWVVNSP